MTNYNNDILEMIPGETPREKYGFLVNMMQSFQEKSVYVENELLNICRERRLIGEKMFRDSGNDSYHDRCVNHDCEMLIFSLTNKFRIDKTKFIKACALIKP